MASSMGREQKRGDAVWKKETRDRIKVLKMGLGDSRSQGSRALFLRATSLLFSVFKCREHLLCYDKISLLCPQSRLPGYWWPWTVVVIFSCKGYHPAGGPKPAYALGKTSWCVQQAVFWTCADPAFQGPHFFRSSAGHDDPNSSHRCTFL